MKKNYVLPALEIVMLNAADIITSSLVAYNNKDLTDELISNLEDELNS